MVAKSTSPTASTAAGPSKTGADGTQPPSIDVCLLIDATGSMSTWIEAARATALSTAEQIRAKVPGAKYRLGYVAYRDLCDGDTRFDIGALSEDVSAVQAAFGRVSASGGGDTPEDVAGGMHHTLQLAWSADTKIAILIADAPAHGFMGSSGGDDHPQGTPDMPPLRTLARRMADAGIDLYFFRIDSCTDLMTDAIKGEYDAAAAARDAAKPKGDSPAAVFAIHDMPRPGQALEPASDLCDGGDDAPVDYSTDVDSYCGRAFQIYIKGLSGAVTPLDVKDDMPIGAVKALYRAKEGSPGSGARLHFIFAGKHLEDGRTLSDYDIQKETILYCGRRLRGGPEAAAAAPAVADEAEAVLGPEAEEDEVAVPFAAIGGAGAVPAAPAECAVPYPVAAESVCAPVRARRIAAPSAPASAAPRAATSFADTMTMCVMASVDRRLARAPSSGGSGLGE